MKLLQIGNAMSRLDCSVCSSHTDEEEFLQTVAKRRNKDKSLDEYHTAVMINSEVCHPLEYHHIKWYHRRCLSIWRRFVSDNLGNTVVFFQPPSLLILKVPMHCRVHWRAGRRPGLCRSTSALLLIGSTIREFLYRLSSVGIGGSVLSALTQFLSNRSQFVLVDGCHSKLVNVVSGVPQAVFWAHCCSFCTPWNFFPFWRISLLVMLTLLWWLLCHPQALELQYLSPWTVTLSEWIRGVTFGGWNWMQVRQRLW